MNYLNRIEQLKQFRESVYNVFTNGSDVLMNLIDALSSNTTAQSVVELSLNPAFERGYSALFKAITFFHQPPSTEQEKQSQKDKSKAANQKETTVKQSQAAALPPNVVSAEATYKQPGATDTPQKPTEATYKQPQIANSPQKAAEATHKQQSPQKAANSPQKAAEVTHKQQSPSQSKKQQQAPAQEQAANQTYSDSTIDESKQVPSSSDIHSKEDIVQILKDRQARNRHEQQLLKIVVPYLLLPAQRPFYLFGLDVTSQPRQFSPTLSDCGFVYHPNPIKGNKPVTIGHQYSLLAYLPEKKKGPTAPWIVPLSTRRVATDQDKELIGMEQIQLLMDDKGLPFHNQLCALVGDTSYSKRSFLAASSKFNNLVTIARVRSDRTFYQKYQPDDESKKGHPTWYGERFSLKEPQTWHEPDYTAQTTFTSRRSNRYIIKIEAWDNMLMKGKYGIEMHKHPFRLLRIRSFKEDGQPAFKRDLWLIVVGKKRQKLELLDIYEAYRQRYDLEHYFRFGKQKLLMTAFQTAKVEREENWWQIVQLAYTGA